MQPSSVPKTTDFGWMTTGLGLLAALVAGLGMFAGVAVTGVGDGLSTAVCLAAEEEHPGHGESPKQDLDQAVTTAPKVVRRWPSVEAFLASQDGHAVGPLSELPVRTDIRQAVVLSVQCLSEHVNWDRTRLPPLNDPANRETGPRASGRYPELYWGAECRKDGTGQFGPKSREHALESGVAHVVGRTLWATLLAEETVGVRPPDETIEVLSRYCRDMYDNPDHLAAFVNRDKDFQRFTICHDLREGLLGLLGLARVRKSEWAARQAGDMVATLQKVTDDEGHLSLAKAREVGLEKRLLGTGNDATTSGRLVGPLVEYHQFSGDPRALELAGRYARAALESTFTSEGRFRGCKSSSGHIHSMTSTLAGVTRYAIFTKNRRMIERCRRVMDQGVPRYASSWGWVDEVMPCHTANEIGRGEINQTGDVIRTALMLGEAGYPGYYELAERYLRSTLLPVQHREDELKLFLKGNDAPEADSTRNVPARVVGGYSMFLPNDRMQEGGWPLTTQDIISGGVHALCESWRHRCTIEEDSWRVNLLLDYEGHGIVIRSSLPLEGTISFRTSAAKVLLIRIPGWVAADTLQLTVDGQSRAVVVEEGYARISGLKAGSQGALRMAVPCKVETETVDGTKYTTTWVGNQLIGVLPRGTVSPLPF